MSDRDDFHPPAPVMDVLDDAVDCIVVGSGGLFVVPAGGYLGVQWLTRKRCYRLTVDLDISRVEQRKAPSAIGARRLEGFERRRGEPIVTGRSSER